MTVAERDVLTQPERRIEGQRKVTGAASFAADLRRPNMLHAAFTWSPHPHARVVSIDTRRARAMPGVRAVLTGPDVAPARFGRRVQDWPVLAWDRVRFVGDRVAAVAADTAEQARAAAAAIDAVYAPLPALFSPEEALAADAAVIHPERDAYRLIGPALLPRPHPNMQARVTHEHGDVEAGFARAAAVFEHTFEASRIFAGYLEPHAAIVWCEGARTRVITTNKGPFVLREQLATALGLDAGSIDVATGDIGGDFGGKGLSLDEFALYFLARATGRPVRSELRYADELRIAGTRRAARVRLRTGIDAEGRITAHEANVLYDGGAYAAGGAGPHLVPSDMATLNPYHVPAARIEVVGAYTNAVPGGSVRAPGQQQIVFAADSHLDAIARAIGADPLSFRERNLAAPGEPNAVGIAWPGSSLPHVIAELRREAGTAPERAGGRGRGVSIGVRHIGRGRATVTLTLGTDGRVGVVTGLPEQGTGVFTAMQRIVARELGLPADRVDVRVDSTDMTSEDLGHGGSRSTPVHGSAALDGARRLRAVVAERAPGSAWDEAAARLGPLVVSGSSDQQVRGYSCYAQCIDVRVDTSTGQVAIENALLIADVGTVINPVAVRGQLEGGFVFGLGAALMEQVIVRDGRVLDGELGDYKLPTMADVPPLRVIPFQGEGGPGPFGAKSVGELSNPGVPPAVANAIADATGVRLTSLPLTAEKIHAALER